MASNSPWIIHIPNALTASNLFCGCLAVSASFGNQYRAALGWIIAAALLDFADGFAARLLNIKSEYGKILDSLADVISFGIAPAAIMHNLFRHIYITSPFLFGIPVSGFFSEIVIFSPFLITVFSGLRLAKFHLDTRQTTSFIGLPTPANALFFSSLAFFLFSSPGRLAQILSSYTFLLPLIILSCYLMISEIPMFALKFKTFRWAKNKIRYFFIIISALLIGFLNIPAIPLIILFYILLSIINYKKTA